MISESTAISTYPKNNPVNTILGIVNIQGQGTWRDGRRALIQAANRQQPNANWLIGISVVTDSTLGTYNAAGLAVII